MDALDAACQLHTRAVLDILEELSASSFGFVVRCYQGMAELLVPLVAFQDKH